MKEPTIFNICGFYRTYLNLQRGGDDSVFRCDWWVVQCLLRQNGAYGMICLILIENNMENKMSGENHNFFDGVFVESNAIGSF